MMKVFGIFARGTDYYDQEELMGLFHDQNHAESCAEEMRMMCDDENDSLYETVNVYQLNVQ